MLLRLLTNLARLLFLPLLLVRRARVLSRGSFVHLTIDGHVTDIARPLRLWERWRKGPTSLVELSDLVDEVLRDARTRGLVVTLRSLRAGMAAATSLRGVLARVVEAKRELVVLLPLGADTKELYVASVGTRVLVGPQATLAPRGFAMSVPYVKHALDRAGLEPEVYRCGEFKSAGESLVRESMSDAHRAQLDALLDTFYGEVVTRIAEGRGLEVARVRELMDRSPFRAEEAVAARLADGVAYDDEVATLLAEDGAEPRRARLVEASRYMGAMRAARFRAVRPGPCIGVVMVHGAITAGSPALRGASEERVIAAVRRAKRDPRVRAVVLHVDSPGGSALASDRIHHELERLAAAKPLVAYFANVAASGGYYVAACAHAIVAQPTSVTGSIGVVAARIVVEPLLSKLGIVMEVLKRGARADALVATRHASDDERTALEREIEGVYRAFVSIVARGRKRTVEDIERVAQGRIWSGAEGAREGLVDSLGGFDVACRHACDLAAKTKGAPRAKVLLPEVVHERGRAPSLHDPPELARQALLELCAQACGPAGAALWGALSSSRERVLAWSPEASTLA